MSFWILFGIIVTVFFSVIAFILWDAYKSYRIIRELQEKDII